MKQNQNSDNTAGAVAPATTFSVLFIGGLADGQRRPDPESQYWKVAGDAPIPRADHDYSKPFEYVRNEEVYRRERLRSGREEWVIYVLASLTTEQAMGKLVRGYPSLSDEVARETGEKKP